MKRRISKFFCALSFAAGLFFLIATTVAALPSLHHHSHDAGDSHDNCAGCVAQNTFAASHLADAPPPVQRAHVFCEWSRTFVLAVFSHAPQTISCRGPPAAS